jgi:hypothetical protein
VAALIGLACATLVAWDGLRRPKPGKVAWAIAFALFALAAGSEVVGAVAGWTPVLARVYYLAGAVLVVGYLALGELYLLAPRRIAAIGPGVALLVTALAATLVWAAPVDTTRLASEGWGAIARGPGLVALAVTINGLGTAVVAGGALVSAWRFWRRGGHRHRLTGCILIAAGTLIVAGGGTLTRLGQREYLYVAMAVGVAVIFAGYLEMRRPEPAPADSDAPASVVPAGAGVAAPRAALVRLPERRLQRESLPTGSAVPTPAVDPAIAFLEERFLTLDEAALSAACRLWSVEAGEADRFDREQARRVWALRLRLSTTGQAALDALAVPTRLQLAELYHEVLTPGVETLARERRAVGGSG